MSIKINETILPTTWSASYNGIDLDKIQVVKNNVTTVVWEKITKVTINNNQIKDYVEIRVDNDYDVVNTSDCENHNGCLQFYNIISYCRDGAEEDKTTYTITPKSPYKSIKATFHNAGGLANEADWRECHINGHEIKYNEVYTIENVQSIEVSLIVGTKGWENHWKTELMVCMYDVTLM